MIKVGVIGAGGIVPSFMEATKMVGGYEYVGIASRTKEKVEAVKEKYGFKYASTNNDDVLTDPNIDAIYIATPNDSHFEIAKKALENNKHVIVEKPFTPTIKEAKEIIDLAKQKGKIVFDAVTLVHMPNYFKIKELLKEIGEVKFIDINFSQYSSRYDKFLKGIILPALDYKKAGGALMDLGIYNINFVLGLFGEPKGVKYFPNIKEKIDTSGILVLDYGTFKANLISAKDCKAPNLTSIQGDKANIRSNYASSVIEKVDLVLNDGTTTSYELNNNNGECHLHEYAEFRRLVEENDLVKAQEYNEFTLLTIKVLEEALIDGGIKFEY